MLRNSPTNCGLIATENADGQPHSKTQKLHQYPNKVAQQIALALNGVPKEPKHFTTILPSQVCTLVMDKEENAVIKLANVDFYVLRNDQNVVVLYKTDVVALVMESRSLLFGSAMGALPPSVARQHVKIELMPTGEIRLTNISESTMEVESKHMCTEMTEGSNPLSENSYLIDLRVIKVAKIRSLTNPTLNVNLYELNGNCFVEGADVRFDRPLNTKPCESFTPFTQGKKCIFTIGRGYFEAKVQPDGRVRISAFGMPKDLTLTIVPRETPKA